MKTSDFDYELPQELIAQTPIEPRDHSRLLVYDRADRSVRHLHFYDLPQFLHAGDALVINETKVIPARLLGQKEDTGVPVELLLLKRLERDVWEALVRPGRRLRPGTMCVFGEGLLRAEIIDNAEDGGRKVRFHYQGVFEEILDRLGQMPLPPYRPAFHAGASGTCAQDGRGCGADRAACGAGHLPSRENGGPQPASHACGAL